jgi:pentatricopeptide repeat protein
MLAALNAFCRNKNTSLLKSEKSSFVYPLDGVLQPWSGIISVEDACAVLKQISDSRVAISFFHWMNNQPQIEVNQRISVILLKSLRQMKDLSALVVFWKSLEKLRIKKNNALYNMMMAAHCDVKEFDEAWKLFAELRGKGIKIHLLTYNTALQVSDMKFGSDAVEELWEEMISRRIVPDQMSYVKLLTSLEKDGKVEKAEVKWKEMMASGDIPDVPQWTKIMDILGKKNLPQRAMAVWEKMKEAKVEPDVWSYR